MWEGEGGSRQQHTRNVTEKLADERASSRGPSDVRTLAVVVTAYLIACEAQWTETRHHYGLNTL